MYLCTHLPQIRCMHRWKGKVQNPFPFINSVHLNYSLLGWTFCTALIVFFVFIMSQMAILLPLSQQLNTVVLMLPERSIVTKGSQTLPKYPPSIKPVFTNLTYLNVIFLMEMAAIYFYLGWSILCFLAVNHHDECFLFSNHAVGNTEPTTFQCIILEI